MRNEEITKKNPKMNHLECMCNCENYHSTLWRLEISLEEGLDSYGSKFISGY